MDASCLKLFTNNGPGASSFGGSFVDYDECPRLVGHAGMLEGKSQMVNVGYDQKPWAAGSAEKSGSDCW